MNAIQIKLIKNYLAGDGIASDRMNAGQGGESLPEWFFTAMAALQKFGVTADNFDEKIKAGKPKEIFDLLAELVAQYEKGCIT